MRKAECDNCITRSKCQKKQSDQGYCDRWEGDCDICTIHGEKLFDCPDCDWEDNEDE